MDGCKGSLSSSDIGIWDGRGPCGRPVTWMGENNTSVKFALLFTCRMPLNHPHLQHIPFTSAVLPHPNICQLCFQCSSRSWPTQSSHTSTFKAISLCSPAICSGLASLRSLPVIISNDIKWEWEEERNPPSSAFPQLPIPKAVMLGQLTLSQFFALAQKLMESVLEGPRSVIANSFSHISPRLCCSFQAPLGLVFLLKITLKQQKKISKDHIVLGEEQQQRCPTIPNTMPMGLSPSASPTPTPPSPQHKHGAGRRQPGSPITLESLGWRSAIARVGSDCQGAGKGEQQRRKRRAQQKQK